MREHGMRGSRRGRSLRVLARALLTVVGLAACNNPTAPPTTPAPSLSGTWEGTWTSTSFGGTGRLTFQLTQSGASISGGALFVEHLCIGGTSLTGTLNATAVTLNGVTPIGARLELRGTIAADGRSMSGSYTDAASAACPLEVGSFSVVKR